MTGEPNIPPEALEAARTAAEKVYGTQFFNEEIRAACIAMLKNWPGMQYDPGALVTDTYRDPGKIILPLTENTNDKS